MEGDESQKDDAMKDVISVVAHQIRSPLATIRLSHQTLLNDEASNLTKKQVYLLEQAEKRAARIYELTEELLLASSDSSFDRGLVIELIDLEDLVGELLSELTVAVNAKDLQVVCDFDDKNKAVLIDKSLISDAITNLLDNAIDYTPRGGTITVSIVHDEREVKLSVTDTGPGVRDGEVVNLFKKFSRLESSGENHTDGLGLGLYIAKRAVVKHGGDLVYKLNQPHGSTFLITLPLSD